MALTLDNCTVKQWNYICDKMNRLEKENKSLQDKINEQAHMVYKAGEDTRKAQKHFDEMLMTQKQSYEKQIEDINKTLSDARTRLIHTETIAQNFISRHAEEDGLPVRSITDIVDNEIFIEQAKNEAMFDMPTEGNFEF